MFHHHHHHPPSALPGPTVSYSYSFIIIIRLIVDDVEEAKLVDALARADDAEPIAQLLFLEEFLRAVLCVDQRWILRMVGCALGVFWGGGASSCFFSGVSSFHILGFPGLKSSRIPPTRSEKRKKKKEKRAEKDDVQIFQIPPRKLGMGHDLDLVVADF